MFSRRSTWLTTLAVACTLAVLAVFGLSSSSNQAQAFPPPHDITGTIVGIAGDLVPDQDVQALTNATAVKNLMVSHGVQKIIHAGDLQYEYGSLGEFNQNYDQVWGGLRNKIAPVIGNHEYGNGAHPDAAGYADYFGAQAYPSGASYYSFNVNVSATKHVNFVILNSNCLDWNTTAPACTSTSAMADFLRTALDEDSAACDIVVWHEPAFGSEVPYWGDGKDAMRTIWNIADAHGADMIVNGHAHNYQRYARMDYLGNKVATGLPSTIIGTGGRSLADVTTFSWSPAALDDTHYGFLKMVFNTTGDGWTQAFKTTTGSGSLDAMSYGCT